MHLVNNRNGDTLDQAARELSVSVRQLQIDMPATIRGGAVVLRNDALKLSRVHLLPRSGDGTDITDVTENVEPDMSYYYLAKVKDPVGTGDTMYEIWYGEENRAHANPSSYFATAKLAWLAVPPDAGDEGQGTIVKLKRRHPYRAIISNFSNGV